MSRRGVLLVTTFNPAVFPLHPRGVTGASIFRFSRAQEIVGSSGTARRRYEERAGGLAACTLVRLRRNDSAIGMAEEDQRHDQ